MSNKKQISALYCNSNEINSIIISHSQSAHGKTILETTLDTINDAVIITDCNGNISFTNIAAEQLCACSQNVLLGQNINHILHLKSTDMRPFNLLDNYSTNIGKPCNKPELITAILKRKDCVSVNVEILIKPFQHQAHCQPNQIIVIHDLTKRYQAEQKAAWQASHDSLTGLPNHVEFEQRLTQLVNHSQYKHKTHGLIYVDIDQFKIINDLCGHMAGDELLRQIAQLFHNLLPSNAFLARLGGDEFGILLSDCNLIQSKQFASQIQQNLEPFRFHSHKQIFAITVSIGLQIIKNYSGDIANLLSTANSACFFAKELGRNRSYEIKTNYKDFSQRKTNMQWISKIRNAIDNDNIILFGQKIIPLNQKQNLDCRIEILTRLLDNKQLISPAKFIETAERYDFMPIIDREIIKKIFSTFQEIKANQHPAININLSAKSLSDDSFADFLSNEIIASPLPAQSICFEITETAAIADLKQAALFISKLQKLGCEFALDDFGTGLSAINHLTNLPINFLKIDGCFVRNIINKNTDLAIFETINRLGQIMGIKTIAEYVESQSIAEQLIKLGVDYGQGFALAKPKPLANLLKHWRSNHCLK